MTIAVDGDDDGAQAHCSGDYDDAATKAFFFKNAVKDNELRLHSFERQVSATVM